MFGKKLKEYVRFERWILILIVAAFVIRLALSLSGTPNTSTRWVSINIVLLVGLIYCAVAVHTTGFGSYKQLFGLLLLQLLLAHLLIASAIALGIVTGTDNIYTAPEYFGYRDGKNWGHVVAHLVGWFVLALIYWLIGSIFLFLTKRLKPVA